MKGLFQIDRLSWRLGLSVALVVILGQAAAFSLVYAFNHRELLTSAREHALLETRLVAQALEHQMLVKDDRLLQRIVSGFARDQTVERVLIFDRAGTVRVSSDPAIQARRFDASSPTCRVCHQHAGEVRPHSAVLTVDGGAVLRCVQPIMNQPACHGCHSPDHRINGLVMVDVPIGATLARSRNSTTIIAVGAGLMGAALLAGIGWIFRRLVLRRLFRFEAAARAIARGELDRRVEVEGGDALAKVEQQFNHMADAVTSLLTEVRSQRASLERVMNSVDDGLAVLDRQRVIVAANDAFLRRFAHGRPQILGGPCCADGAGENAGCGSSGGSCPVLECFTSGAVQTSIRLRRLADGSVRQDEVRASPIYGDNGAINYVVEAWRDITDRRSAEARLAEYQRLVSLGMLASGFSHEVNTPLASIATCVDGIQRLCLESAVLSREDKQSVEDYARIAATQVARCGGITEQFLRLARGRSLERDIVDVVECAGATGRLCMHQARSMGATLEVAAGEGIPVVAANASAVQQVLLNLVLNALEACEHHPRVRISFALNEHVEVRVEDNGRGIVAEDMGRLFEPFFSRREKGTGLGLFVSMNLARSWGGDIRVASTAGRGSTFTLVFPRVPVGP